MLSTRLPPVGERIYITGQSQQGGSDEGAPTRVEAGLESPTEVLDAGFGVGRG